MFSILIPSWNNLPYLKLCVASIRKHSAVEHEILVHVNEGSDGTLAWVKENGIAHTWSRGNVGVCFALNDIARMASKHWIVFMNDDMFCTPGWDSALIAAADKLGDVPAYLAAHMIEPQNTGNSIMTVANFGIGPDDFNESGLLEFSAKMDSADRDRLALQPMLVSRELWHRVGGYSIEFSPGMCSDDDFLMKLWLVGCRVYRSVGASHVYHFGCRTTGRVRRNRGSREFLLKWGITMRDFKRNYIGRTGDGDAKDLPNIPKPNWVSRFKRTVYSMGTYPLQDLEAWEPELPSQLTSTRALKDE